MRLPHAHRMTLAERMRSRFPRPAHVQPQPTVLTRRSLRVLTREEPVPGATYIVPAFDPGWTPTGERTDTHHAHMGRKEHTA